MSSRKISASDLLSRIADAVCNSEEKDQHTERAPSQKKKLVKSRLRPSFANASVESVPTLPPLSAAAVAALEHVRTITAKRSGAALTRTLAAVGQRFREAPLLIHIHADTLLPLLLKDTHYRNQFEVRPPQF
jgi:hypothetical protein